MNDIFAGTIILIGGIVTLTALLTTLVFLLPQRIERTRRALLASSKQAFGIGLVNIIFFGLLAALLLQGGELFQLIGLLLALALLALASLGLAAILLLLRQRIYIQPTSEIQVTLKTAVLLIAAGLSPFVGWFVLTPLTLITGLGAVILTIVRREKETADTTLSQQLPY
jgi:hypothetical protein